MSDSSDIVPRTNFRVLFVGCSRCHLYPVVRLRRQKGQGQVRLGLGFTTTFHPRMCNAVSADLSMRYCIAPWFPAVCMLSHVSSKQFPFNRLFHDTVLSKSCRQKHCLVLNSVAPGTKRPRRPFAKAIQPKHEHI